MSQTFFYGFPTEIHFGPGARNLIPNVLKSESCTNPLIVTDQGVVKLDWFGELQESLSSQGLRISVYSEIWGNPVKSQVTQGVDAFKNSKSDSIIALGGGAAMDVAKGIALMAEHPGDLFDYEDGKPDARPVDKPIPYMIAVPTTAGTGSEVGRSGVVSDDKTKEKKIYFSPRLLPSQVFADPELTLGLPPKMTAATGLDALTHLTEAFLAKGYHPMCDGIALEGIRLIHKSLVQCVQLAEGAKKTPEHVEARGDLLNAAMMGAVAFQKGLGANHSFAHSLSTVCDLHHGLANGIMLPYVMKFNSEAVPERFERMAAFIGEKNYVGWIQTLNEKVGIPKTLAEAGVTRENLPDLVHYAQKDGCHTLNPRPLTESDFKRIYEEALGG